MCLSQFAIKLEHSSRLSDSVVTFVIVRTPDSGGRNYMAGLQRHACRWPNMSTPTFNQQQLQWLTMKICSMSIVQLQMQCGNNIHVKVVKLLNRWKIDFVRLGIREKLQFLPNFTINLPFACCSCCNRRTDI